MRRNSRELALQTLFQFEFTPDQETGTVQDVAEHFQALVEPELSGYARLDVDKEILDFADSIVVGVRCNQDSIDRLIRALSQKWSLDRMSSVDRNILRIAIWEMKFMNPPQDPGVAINEAVEIAKKYGTTDSFAFVNGILDQARL